MNELMETTQIEIIEINRNINILCLLFLLFFVIRRRRRRRRNASFLPLVMDRTW